MFAKSIVDILVKDGPQNYTSTIKKSERTKKIFIDYLRNQRGATSVAPYSIRAKKWAPIATPIAWDELTDQYRDTFFTINTLAGRLKYLKKDPWEKFFKLKQLL